MEKSADQMDEIQYASERDLAMRNADRESSRLRDVKAALRRIHDGSFGTCIEYLFFWERRSLLHSATALLERRSEEHLDDIFEEYTSYTGGQDRSGGGLGLAICKMTISLHGGRVWAENTEFGPQFSFVIPLRPPDSGRSTRRETETTNYVEAR